MLAATNFSQDAGTGTLAFESLQSAFQGLVLTDPDLHFLSLPSLAALPNEKTLEEIICKTRPDVNSELCPNAERSLRHA